METELSGRVAIVTGSARNIGRAIAIALARAGAAVVVTTLQSADAAESTAQEIRASGGRAILKLDDIREPAQARALVASAVEAFGRLDILVNNAAVRHETDLATVTYEEWRAVVSVILDGAFLMTQAAMPHLIGSDCGSVINIGGMTAHVGAPRRGVVPPAKLGLVGPARALARAFVPPGARRRRGGGRNRSGRAARVHDHRRPAQGLGSQCGSRQWRARPRSRSQRHHVHAVGRASRRRRASQRQYSGGAGDG